MSSLPFIDRAHSVPPFQVAVPSKFISGIFTHPLTDILLLEYVNLFMSFQTRKISHRLLSKNHWSENALFIAGSIEQPSSLTIPAFAQATQ